MVGRRPRAAGRFLVAGQGLRSLAVLALLALIAAGPGGLHADDWPQWLGPQRDGVWRETGLVEKFPEGGPKLLWRMPLGPGYTGPAVANGRVFVLDRVVTKDARVPTNPFNSQAIPGSERILCFDAKTGAQQWVHEYPCTYRMIYPLGPRCTPSVDGGKVYSLGAMGHLICLDAATGKVDWEVDLPQRYQTAVPGAGYAAHPLVDGDKLIVMVGGQGSAVVAFDKRTGTELWKALSAPEAGYAPPVLFHSAGVRQLLAWDPAQISSLNPETGEVYWTEPLRSQMNMNVVMPRVENDLIFLSLFFQGSTLLRLDPDKPGMTVVYKNKADTKSGIKCMNATPYLREGYVYGVCGSGELRCLKLETNERGSQELKPVVPSGRPTRHGTAFLIPAGDRTIIFNENGELILAKLTPEGYQEIDRAKVIKPTFAAGGRDVVWCHPAFADRCMFVRNDEEIICVSLAQGPLPCPLPSALASSAWPRSTTG